MYKVIFIYFNKIVSLKMLAFIESFKTILKSVSKFFVRCKRTYNLNNFSLYNL